MPKPASIKMSNEERKERLTVNNNNLVRLVLEQVEILMYEDQSAYDVLVLSGNMRSILRNPFVRVAEDSLLDLVQGTSGQLLLGELCID